MKGVTPILVSAFFTLFILCVHLFSGITTMINGGSSGLSNFALAETVKLHKVHPVFLRRKATTWIIEVLSKILNIEIGLSFVIVNFLFLFLSGILIYLLAKQITQNIKFSLFSMAAYFLCFSNLFAFFPPVYTYDEPLQFCFVISSLLFFFKNKYWWFIILFSISLLIRESGIIILPGLFFAFIYNSRKDIMVNIRNLDFLKKTLGLLIPIVIYLLYIYLLMVDNNSREDSKDYFFQRLSFIKWNLQSMRFAIESICSMLLIFALPFYLLNNRFRKKNITGSLTKKMIKAFLITFLINTVVVFLNTRAREVRLFVIPLFFLWPIFGTLFINDFKLLFNYKIYKEAFLKRYNMFYFVLLNIIAFIITFIIYQPTSGPRIGVFNLYLFITFNVIIVHFLLGKYLKGKE